VEHPAKNLREHFPYLSTLARHLPALGCALPEIDRKDGHSDESADRALRREVADITPDIQDEPGAGRECNGKLPGTSAQSRGCVPVY